MGVSDRGADRRVDLDAPERVAAASRLVPTGANATLDQLCVLAARLLGTDSAQVSLLTDSQYVAGGVGLGAAAAKAGPTPRQESLCTVTAGGARPLVVPDAPLHEAVRQLPPVTSGAVASYLGVPLFDDCGHVVGSLCVYGTEATDWQPKQVGVLEGLGAAVVAELERAAAVAERDQAQFRLGVAVSAGGIGTWDWEVSSERLRVDERTMSMFGLPIGPAVLSLADVERRVHPEDTHRFGPALRAAVGDGADYADEFRVVGADGQVRWLVGRGRPLRDVAGQAVRVVGAVYETTEQHEAAASASASADLVRLLAAASDLLTGSLDPEDAVRSLTRVVVPRLADWSVVSLRGADDQLRDVAAWHRDEAMRPITERFARHRLEGREDPVGSLAAFAEGAPFVLEEGVREFAYEALRSREAVAALDELDIASVVVVPLMAEETVIGLITLARGQDRPPMDSGELATAVDLSRRASIALNIARLYGLEREMSEGLQRSLLTEPVQPDHLEVVVRYVPASAAAQVGGDWYDAFMQPDGATVLVVGDVVGHDTAAAAAMGQLRNLLRGVAVSRGESPANVLEQVDHAMETLRLETTATAVVARIEQDLDEIGAGVTRLRWSNAGHPPAVILHADGSTQRLDEHDLLLGVVPETERSERMVTLERGATVLMFTDGLVERRDEDLDTGLSRVEKVADALRDEPLQDLADELLSTLVPGAPDDDIALLAVRLHPQDRPRPAEAGPVVVPRNVPADPAPGRASY